VVPHAQVCESARGGAYGSVRARWWWGLGDRWSMVEEVVMVEVVVVSATAVRRVRVLCSGRRKR